MESLQLAQMLADLSSLNATEPDAARALVTANKSIDKTESHQHQHGTLPGHPSDDLSHTTSPLSPAHSRNHSRSGTGHNTPAARFDKYGRRILTSPPLTRANSSPGTPRRDSDAEEPGGHSDVDRASTLMALYEIRTKLKQQDNKSLVKAREKIADLAARQQAQSQSHALGKKDGGKGHGSRYMYPK